MANYDLTYEGSEVQGILNTGNSLKDAGYIFRGEATPSTVPGTPTERVAYIGGPGTYTNFGDSITVPAGCVCIFKYNGSAWTNQVIDAQGASEGIFDLSAYNAQGDTLATYADLSAALTALNALPSDFKKGGMSLKFVLSSDNNYVKFFCTAQNFTTDVTKWQGVDDEPVAGSKNLVESGSVYDRVYLLDSIIEKQLIRSTQNIPSGGNYSYIAGNANFQQGKKYILYIQSDKNIEQPSVWITLFNNSTVVEDIFAHQVDYLDLSKGYFVEFIPASNANSIVVTLHTPSVSGNITLLVIEKDNLLNNNNIFSLLDLQDSLYKAVNISEREYPQRQGYVTTISAFPLVSGKKYKIILKADKNLQQSILYVSASNGGTIVAEAIAHYTSEDLSVERSFEYEASSNSSDLLVSIQNVQSEGSIRFVAKEIGEYIDSSDIVTRNEFKTVYGGGYLSSIVGSALVANITNVPVSLYSSLIYNSKNVKLCGEIWGYSTDPNGVYPADKGSILELPNKSTDNGDYLLNPFPAILVTGVGHTSGIIEEIGINGYANDSDSRGLFDISDVSKHAGIHVAANSVVDQFRINHINCQGLGVGVSIINSDASHIDRINADGCDVGIYLGGGAFTGIENCILSDTLSYGLLIWGFGELGNVVGARILNNVFTRNGYNISAEQFPNIPQYSVCLKMDSSYFRGNQISAAGFWHKYDEGEEYLYNYNIGGLYIQGNSNIVSNNLISTLNDSTAFALEINGNNNVIDDSNIISGKVKISGGANILKYISGVTDIYVTADSNNIIDSIYDSSIIHYL